MGSVIGTVYELVPVLPCILVSHHPPVSAFYYISPANKLCILGELRPKSKFLGNSVSTTMEGENRVLLTGRPDDGGTQPSKSLIDRNCGSLMQIYSLCRICDFHAKHVRTRYTLGEDGVRARGYLHSQERASRFEC